MPKQITLFIKAVVPANHPAGVPVSAQLSGDGIRYEDAKTTPVSKIWVLDDIYIVGTPAVDGHLILKKEDNPKVVTPPISALSASNPTRPQIDALMVGQGEKLSVDFIPATSPSEDKTVLVYARVVEFDLASDEDVAALAEELGIPPEELALEESELETM